MACQPRVLLPLLHFFLYDMCLNTVGSLKVPDMAWENQTRLSFHRIGMSEVFSKLILWVATQILSELSHQTMRKWSNWYFWSFSQVLFFSQFSIVRVAPCLYQSVSVNEVMKKNICNSFVGVNSVLPLTHSRRTDRWFTWKRGPLWKRRFSAWKSLFSVSMLDLQKVNRKKRPGPVGCPWRKNLSNPHWHGWEWVPVRHWWRRVSDQKGRSRRFASVTDVGIFRGCWERKFGKRFMDESSETSRCQGFKTFFLLEI